MRIYRIASARHTLWDGTGAAIIGGRWNSAGQPVIYASMTFAGAMLEVLAHTGIGKIPRSHQCIVAEVPKGTRTTRYSTTDLPKGWDHQDSAVARQIGDAWLGAAKTAILIVPSVVARIEFNVLVNPRHPDASKITIAKQAQDVQWDQRLFSR